VFIVINTVAREEKVSERNRVSTGFEKLATVTQF